MLPSRDRQSHNSHHHRHFPPQRCWVFQGPRVLALTPIPLSSSSKCISTLHTSTASQRVSPHSPSGQSVKSTSQRQRQSGLPCSAKRNSPPVMPSQCYRVNHPPLPSLGAQTERIAAAQSLMLSGAPRLPPPSGSQAPQPAGYLPATPAVLLFILFVKSVVLLYLTVLTVR